jgi:putative ABC transport system substrate-binding protein
LFVSQDGFLISRRLQLANMVARHAVPMTSSSRDIAEVGGLMSYGTNITEVFRQMGVYTGRIHKGAKRRQDARPRRAVDAARARR